MHDSDAGSTEHTAGGKWKTELFGVYVHMVLHLLHAVLTEQSKEIQYNIPVNNGYRFAAAACITRHDHYWSF